MTSKQQEFYSYIGRISVGFSNLENKIIDIIGLLINSDDDFIKQILLEENSISQNLKLLLKLNKYRHTQQENIKSLHTSIDKLRIKRNLFIHGLWSMRENEQSELIFVCETKKVEFKKGTYGVLSYLNSFLEFQIQDLENELMQIKQCSEIASNIVSAISKKGLI